MLLGMIERLLHVGARVPAMPSRNAVTMWHALTMRAVRAVRMHTLKSAEGGMNAGRGEWHTVTNTTRRVVTVRVVAAAEAVQCSLLAEPRKHAAGTAAVLVGGC